MSPLTILISFSMQVAALVAVASMVSALTRLRAPVALLAHYRLTFLVVVVVPLATTIWQPDPMMSVGTPMTVLVEASKDAFTQAPPGLLTLAWRIFVVATGLRLLWLARNCWQLRRLRLAGGFSRPSPRSSRRLSV